MTQPQFLIQIDRKWWYNGPQRSLTLYPRLAVQLENVEALRVARKLQTQHPTWVVIVLEAAEVIEV